jgi:hypothetical protein
MEAVSISQLVERCSRVFITLASALSTTESFASQVTPAAIDDEFDRFKLWAGNIAAHKQGRRSLEHRLRDATNLRDRAWELLLSLEQGLSESLAIVNHEKIPWDELSDSDSDSASSLDIPDQDNLQGDTELKQLHAGTREIITCLFRLSISIRDPAPYNQFRQPLMMDKTYFEPYDIEHVRGKFPLCQKFLVERLGRANSARRQYLTYREEHHKRLASGIERLGRDGAQSEYTANSTEATPLPTTDLANQLLEHDNDDSVSLTSFATSVNATLRCPPLPEEGLEQKPFQCPFCYMMVSIDSAWAWR